MTDDSVFCFSQLCHVFGNDKQLLWILALLLWYLHIHTHTHLHAQSHADHSHACIGCQLSQTVGNPPPLKQKDLFLSCNRHTHEYQLLFSEHYSNSHTSLSHCGVAADMQSSGSDCAIHVSIFVRGKKQLDTKKSEYMNMLIETAEVAAKFMLYILKVAPLSSLIQKCW